MADLPMLRLRLAEAELAEHELTIGTATAKISYGNNDSLTYTRTSLPALQTYIAGLKGRIGTLEGQPNRRRPIHMAF